MKRAPVLLAVLTTTALLLAGCGSDTPPAATPTSSSSPTPTARTTASPVAPTTAPAKSATVPTPTPTSSTSPSEPDAGTFIDYEKTDESGVIVTQTADTAKLTGASADFKAFIAAELSRSRAELDKGCPENPQIYVSRLATGGWAAGGYFIPQCGGYAALWAKSAGTWKEAWAGQELVGCATLTKYAFPASVSGTSCLDGDKSVKYPRG